jgi:hypothetical protein
LCGNFSSLSTASRIQAPRTRAFPPFWMSTLGLVWEFEGGGGMKSFGGSSTRLRRA